jgi:hypothetical protein
LKLANPGTPSHIAIEHALSGESPSRSAPKEILFVGFADDSLQTTLFSQTVQFLGTEPSQVFELSSAVKVQKVGAFQVQILSNHGQTYTCLYRVRLFGKLAV